jgi:hypothetical protein
MTTVINNPGEGEASGVSWIIGVVVVIILGALFFMYAVPAMRGGAADDNDSANINVEIPTGGGNDGGGDGGAGGGTGGGAQQ